MTDEAKRLKAMGFAVCPKCGKTRPAAMRKCVLCAPPVAAKPKRVKAQTWQTPRGKVKNALRLLSLRCRERAEALKRAGYSCGRCGAKQSKARGKEVAIEVHHMDPIAAENAMQRIIDMIFEYILVAPEAWEVLCKECHASEHNKEVAK